MAEEDVEPLITECPSCGTRFRVTENQLQVAAGRVRCGSCLTVFQGVEHLLWDDEPRFENDLEAQSALDELLSELGGEASSEVSVFPAQQAAPESPAELPDLDALGNDAIAAAGEAQEEWVEPPHQLYGGHEEPADDDVTEELVIDQVPAPMGETVAATPAETDASTEAPAVRQHDEPDQSGADSVRAASDPDQPLWISPAAEPFDFREEPRNPRWWVTAASVAAAILLVAQVLWYQFESWSRDPDIRPIYGVLCKVLGCELPLMRDVDSMLAQNLVVRSHPEVANALLVNAIIVNQADFPQPFPILELRFTALNGTLVARRGFEPDEYLAGELAGATVMPPHTPIHVELAIEDPGDAAVNYFLTFR